MMDNEHGFILPDYENCNINISATLAEFLGAPNRNATLPLLRGILRDKPENVVFICFDGLGIYPIEKNLDEDDILRKNIRAVLTSTFPSTTTCATASLNSNTLPYEHGRFGWSMYIERLDRNVDIFPRVDSWTKQPVDVTGWGIDEPGCYYDMAENEEYRVNTVNQPFYKVKHPENNHVFESEERLFEIIRNICSGKNNRAICKKQFVYAYYSEPDTTMHINGVSSTEARKKISALSDGVRRLYESTTDTLFIITADHGQIDVADTIYIYEDAELMDTLLLYPYLEPRAVAFRVKPGRKKDFERLFTARYGKDFALYPSGYLIENGLFGGKGEKCGMLGDYIAIGTYTHKIIRAAPTAKRYKGHHTSLTEEMEVPLIILRN